MSKYSEKELKAMAKTVLEAKERGDVKYLQFVMNVSITAGVDPSFVDKKIHEYAESAV